jgi:ADP-ribose pyrophosphatase YjhB (NUDIX family)
MPQSFSQLQNYILTRLKNAKALRYSEIQLKGIPNDLFNYHLQFLVKKGFIEKAEEGYALSSIGVKHIADAYPLNDKDKLIASLFKINVITIASRVRNGKIEILTQIRKVHPSYGKVGVMGGVVRKGELMEHAASRKFKEETGLEATFNILGMERRMLYVQDKLFSDVMFPIAYTDTCSGELIADTAYGHNEWAPLSQAIKNESTEFDHIKKIVHVLKAIKKGTVKKLPFFYSEDIQKGESI